MSFFSDIKNSIYSPQFYSRIPEDTFNNALNYYVLLSLLLTLASAILPVTSFFRAGKNQLNSFFEKLVNIYPVELVLTVQNGQVTSNVDEPYFVVNPWDSNNNKNPFFVAVIDTQTPYSAAQFNAYNTVIWVNADTVFVRGNNGDYDIRAVDLSQIEDFTLNRQTVDQIAKNIKPWLKLIIPVITLFILFGLYLFYLIRLVYILILALGIWIMTNIVNKPLSYSQSYKVGIHAVTLGYLAEIALSWLKITGFPFMFTLITLAVALVNLYQAPKPAKPKAR